MNTVLEVSGLKTYFYTSTGIVKAVDGVTFDIRKGEVFGLVGESGSGKTMTGLSILRLVYPPAGISGSVLFNGEDLMKADGERMRSLRGSRISVVFQEPGTSFNPVLTVGRQVSECAQAHRNIGSKEAREITLHYLEKVKIKEPGRIYRSYPHQLSGGTKQRAGIAAALINSPELVILDEPTTALDVTIQAAILDLLEEIIRQERLSILFISHDFGVVRRMCPRAAVMRRGRIVESGRTDELLRNPKEEYTMSLLESERALSCL